MHPPRDLLEDADRVPWRWIGVAAVLLLVGVPIALMGLYATGDLCNADVTDDGRLVGYDSHENVIETLIVRCTGTDRDGTEVEDTKINWIGGGAALVFLVGFFYAAAGVVGAVSRKRAAVITTTCALVCFGLVVVWFV